MAGLPGKSKIPTRNPLILNPGFLKTERSGKLRKVLAESKKHKTIRVGRKKALKSTVRRRAGCRGFRNVFYNAWF